MLLDENALLIQILVPIQYFAQTEHVLRDHRVVQSSSGYSRFSSRQLPNSFPDSKAEVLAAAAFVLYKIVRAVLAGLIPLHVIGREVVQTIQGMVSIVALSYTETVVPKTLSDTERVLPSSLRIKFQHACHYKKLILILLKIYQTFFKCYNSFASIVTYE